MNCKNCKYYKEHYFLGEVGSSVLSVSCELAQKEYKSYTGIPLIERKLLAKICPKEAKNEN